MAKNEQNAKIGREMRQHVVSWQASKMSSQAYCADKGFTVHKLYYWFNKVKKEQSDTPSANTGFTRVRPKEIPHAAQGLSNSTLPFLEVNLSNGTRLVFYQAISNDLLNVFL
jgi:hypothetical protein